MSYLLDTCVVSELVARRPSQRVLAWLDSIEETHLYLSAITVGEIRKGIARLPASQRRRALEDWLTDQLLPRFEGRLVAIDAAVMLRWGLLVSSLEMAGKTMAAMDSLIAASALHAGLSLVTHNESDFTGTGVDIVNPWRP